MRALKDDIPGASGCTEPGFLGFGALGGHVLFVDGDGLNKRHVGFLHSPEIYPVRESFIDRDRAHELHQHSAAMRAPGKSGFHSAARQLFR
jgi:hypothetical protein